MNRKNVFFKRRDAYTKRWETEKGFYSETTIAKDAFAAGWKARGREESKKCGTR